MVKTRSPRKKPSPVKAKPLMVQRLKTQLSNTSTKVPTPAANIRVVVRTRPPNSKEQCANHRNVLKLVDERMLLFDPEEDNEPFFYHGVQQKSRDFLKKANKNMQFLFDRVFGFESTNKEIFEFSTKELIFALMDGYNCSVFAYGATGAGKTFTMLGNCRQPGITFLTMAELFKQKQELSSERDFELGVSYLEVYNENVQDLLNPGPYLQLREDKKVGVIVAGIQIRKIDAADQLFELLEKGNKNRTQHPTDANRESSRSHAVFQVYLRMSIKATGEVRLAKLSMIDLAGSERGSATGCTGARFTEGANINKSLLALGNCINGLADGQKHIPYRDSKLTRLLKDSLGGNCQTVMIANVSPSSMSYEDTYNTLKYALRATKIKSTLKKNVVSCEMHVHQYVKIVEDLNKENEKLKALLKAKEVCTLCKGDASNIKSPNSKTIDKKPEKIPVNNTIDPSKKQTLLDMYSAKTKMQNQIHELMLKEKMLVLRKKLKQESDSRLSGLCTTDNDKQKGHKRFEITMSKFEAQLEELKDKSDSLKEGIAKHHVAIQDFLKRSPELEQIAQIEDSKFVTLETIHEMEYLKNVSELQNDELQKRNEMLCHMADVLRPCFLMLRGSGIASDAIIKKYRTLVREVQGIEAVSWKSPINCPSDSGLGSGQESEETLNKSVGWKRKHDDLDSTFVINDKNAKDLVAENVLKKANITDGPSSAKKPNIRPARGYPTIADRLLVKIYEPPAKRMVKTKSATYIQKENRLANRSPCGMKKHTSLKCKYLN